MTETQKAADSARSARAANFWIGIKQFGGALTSREDRFFLLLSVMIGIFSGLSVVCFRMAYEWVRLWLLTSAEAPPKLRLLLVPAIAGLLIAIFVKRFYPGLRGSGVNQTKTAVYISDGDIPFNTVWGKFLSAGLAIGAGFSLGPEDPSLQIGAGIASVIGRKLRLSRENLRLIAPVGAAAGLAAAFNAPIAAVIFVIEEVVGKWSSGILGAVVLSAVSSVVVMRGFLGPEPLFSIPTIPPLHPAELLGYAALGVIGGAVSLFFVKVIVSLRSWLRSLPDWTQYIQPAIAGLLVGVMGIWLPQVLGAGYDVMDQTMHGRYVWQLLGVLALAKVIATAFSFSSGTPGGMFAPALFVGAMVGGAVGGFEHHFFPAVTGGVGVYALVGMGTLFAGFLRAPMTSVFMVLEVSGNYSIILPVMISNTIAYLISLKYQPVPIFDLLSRQDGLELPSLEEEREEESLHVEDAMHPPAAAALRAEKTIEQVRVDIEKSQQEWLLIYDRTRGWRLARRAELLEKAATMPANTRLADIIPKEQVPVVHPDNSIDLPLRKLGDRPFLPVVHRAHPERLIGIVSREDVLRAYAKTGMEEVSIPGPS
ncbi:MAG TPA: chloride channel protein [Candidatus Aquilonibacter sp.]|nr:chloride channel protein [Candidatus Aquilonibacter sp.]